jgi:hypothetical protein
MLTMAANSVVNEKHTPDYWDIEKRWIAVNLKKLSIKK